MCDVPTYQEYSGSISPPGDTPTDQKEAKKEVVWELGLPTFGGGNSKVGLVGGGNVCNLPPEHSCTVHRNHTHCLHVSSGVALPWGAGVAEMVGAGELGPGGYVGIGKVAGDVRGGGGRVWRQAVLGGGYYCSN